MLQLHLLQYTELIFWLELTLTIPKRIPTVLFFILPVFISHSRILPTAVIVSCLCKGPQLPDPNLKLNPNPVMALCNAGPLR